jgi:hypothetical protein
MFRSSENWEARTVNRAKRNQNFYRLGAEGGIVIALLGKLLLMKYLNKNTYKIKKFFFSLKQSHERFLSLISPSLFYDEKKETRL